MQIGTRIPAAHLLTPARLARTTAAAPALPTPLHVLEPSAVLSPPPLSIPDFARDVDVKGHPGRPDEGLDKATDIWVKDHVQIRDARELPAFQGLGRWLGWQAKAKARPDWTSFAHADQTISLWYDEYQDASSALASAKPASKESEVQLPIKKSLMVLRMLDGYLGEGVVDQAVRQCLSTSTQRPQGLEEFYALLKDKAPKGKPLPSWSQAKAWFTEVGHPVITSRLVGKGAKTCLQLEQNVFSVYPDQPVANKGTTWAVPMRVKFKDDEGIKEITALMDGPRALVELPAKGKVAWAYPNGGGAGVFRTNLQGEELRAITKDAAQLTPAEQGALACNQWRMVRHGAADIGEFYDLCMASRNTLDPGLHYILAIELSTHSSYVRPEDRVAFDKFWAAMVGPIARSRGLDPGRESDAERRDSATDAVQVLARAGDPEALRLAQSWADEYKRTGVPPVRYNSYTFSADPEILASLRQTALDPSRSSKERATAISDLSFWNTREGAETVMDILQDPESGLPQADRELARKYLPYRGHGRDLLLASLQENPKAVETLKEIVKDTYSFPCYRPELAQLLESPKISPEVRAELKEHFSKGDKKTLVNLSGGIHRWLENSHFLPATTPQMSWNLTA